MVVTFPDCPEPPCHRRRPARRLPGKAAAARRVKAVWKAPDRSVLRHRSRCVVRGMPLVAPESSRSHVSPRQALPHPQPASTPFSHRAATNHQNIHCSLWSLFWASAADRAGRASNTGVGPTVGSTVLSIRSILLPRLPWCSGLPANSPHSAIALPHLCPDFMRKHGTPRIVCSGLILCLHAPE